MARPPHLTPDEVMLILDFIADCDPIVVGGQSVNLLAQHYAGRDPSLAAMGPFTSKDLDLFANRAATERLAANLADSTVFIPSVDDASPNAAVVVGMLGQRQIVVDFMADVLGVDPASINQNYVAIEGDAPGQGRTVTLLVMNPLDCVRSRLANVNTLHRTDEQSLRQAEASVKILRHFIDDMLRVEEFRFAQRLLHDLEFVIRDNHIGKDTHLEFGTRLDLFGIADAFVDDERFDARWREMILVRSVSRLRDRADRLVARRRPEPNGA